VHVVHGIGRFWHEDHPQDSGRRGVPHVLFAIRLVSTCRGQIDLVQSTSAWGVSPAAHQARGTRWASKARVVESRSADLAADSFRIQAPRSSRKDFLSDDTIWQREFGEPSSTRKPKSVDSLDEIKRDMRRLSHGPAAVRGRGYGKNELAIRAAFKAGCTASRCLLVPTTVLAVQHEAPSANAWRLPFIIEAVSRFKTDQAGQRRSSAVRRGQVVSSRHPPLAELGCASWIGLLVIEEEQRFGVETRSGSTLPRNRLRADHDSHAHTATLHMTLLAPRYPHCHAPLDRRAS
jgi:transcription-repair coupling factor (superfamily II helicase)